MYSITKQHHQSVFSDTLKHLFYFLAWISACVEPRSVVGSVLCWCSWWGLFKWSVLVSLGDGFHPNCTTRSIQVWPLYAPAPLSPVICAINLAECPCQLACVAFLSSGPFRPQAYLFILAPRISWLKTDIERLKSVARWMFFQSFT